MTAPIGCWLFHTCITDTVTSNVLQKLPCTLRLANARPNLTQIPAVSSSNAWTGPYRCQLLLTIDTNAHRSHILNFYDNHQISTFGFHDPLLTTSIQRRRWSAPFKCRVLVVAISWYMSRFSDGVITACHRTSSFSAATFLREFADYNGAK